MAVGFVGLGVMGGPMAGHLLAAGNELVVWTRTPAKAEPLVASGATRAENLTELARACETVVVCVSRTEDVEAVVEGLRPGLQEGALIIDHSTIAPAAARALATSLAADGVSFLDAPVTGGSMGAKAGQLTVFCGGEPDVYQRAEPVMAAYSKRTALVGPSGAGQTMKVANQIAVGGALLGLCESLAFAQRAGLDLVQTRELLAGGAAGSWAFDNYGPKVLARDWTPGFSIANQRKDFGYAREAAGEVGAPIPGVDLVDSLLAVLDEEGHGDWTTAALFDLLARGVKPA